MLKKNQSVIYIQKILLLQKDLSQGVLSNIYNRWHQENQYLGFLAAGPLVNFVKTFAEFPPRQPAASLNINEAINKALKAGNH